MKKFSIITVLQKNLLSCILGLFAFCFLSFHSSAASLDDTITGGVSYQFAYDWAYSHNVPGVTITDNIIISPIPNYIANGVGGFYIRFFQSSSDISLVISNGSYRTSSAVTWCGYILYKANATTWSWQSKSEVNTSSLSIISTSQSFDDVFSSSNNFYFNGDNVISPPKQYDASYYIGAQGYTIKAGVFPTADSIHNGWWYETIDYTLQFTVDYQGNPLSFALPSYISWFMDVEPYDDLQNVYAYPYSNVQSTYHSIKYFNSAGVVFNSYDSPIINYPYDENLPDYVDQHWDDLPKNLMSISLSSMLEFLRAEYPAYNFSDTFLYQDIICSWVGADDNKIYYTNTLNYSAVESEAAPPPADDNTINYFDSLNDIKSILNSNSYYYSELLSVPASYVKPVSKNISLNGLQGLPDFDYNFTVPEVDSDSVDFFAWLTTFIFNTPLGFVFTACLAFLLIGVIFH